MEPRKKISLGDLKSVKSDVVEKVMLQKRADDIVLGKAVNLDRANSDRNRQILECVTYLCQTYPKCFNLKNRLPLKTNIVKDIFAELGEDTPFSRRQIRDAIAYYTYSYFYQKKIVRGHSRIDLQGNEVEEPSTRHKKYATKLMKKQPVTIKKFGARKISEPARVG